MLICGVHWFLGWCVLQGYTALHLAAIHGHEHIIELLVQTFSKWFTVYLLGMAPRPLVSGLLFTC